MGRVELVEFSDDEFGGVAGGLLGGVGDHFAEAVAADAFGPGGEGDGEDNAAGVDADSDEPVSGFGFGLNGVNAGHRRAEPEGFTSRTRVQNTTVFLGNLGRAQKTERTRLEAQRDRAVRVLADIDAAGAPTPAGTAAGEN